MLLIGRREQRSLNSWMHNLPTLTGGKGRCTARLHRSDVKRLGLEDGQDVILSSRVGAITITVEASDDLMPGVVSVPHGWGHDAPDAQLRVASGQAGINVNVLSDEQVVDAPLRDDRHERDPGDSRSRLANDPVHDRHVGHRLVGPRRSSGAY